MMSLANIRALVTGGGGGIGTAIAQQLLARGASVLLVDRDPAALRSVAARLGAADAGGVDAGAAFVGAADTGGVDVGAALVGAADAGGAGAGASQQFAAGAGVVASQASAAGAGRIATHVADLTRAGDRARLLEVAAQWQGGVNTLVNNAGVNHFGMFQDQQAAQIELALAVNVHAPIQLCRGLLPQLARQDVAHIVNMGSVFGSIGYPGYAVYSATKFAMRGFTEALRRELAGSSVHVHYVAPRATRTPINAAAVERMNAELGVAMDEPAVVGAALCRMLERDLPFAVVGWPEKLFARVNAVLPGAVDGALRKQLPVIRRYASGG